MASLVGGVSLFGAVSAATAAPMDGNPVVAAVGQDGPVADNRLAEMRAGYSIDGTDIRVGVEVDGTVTADNVTTRFDLEQSLNETEASLEINDESTGIESEAELETENLTLDIDETSQLIKTVLQVGPGNSAPDTSDLPDTAGVATIIQNTIDGADIDLNQEITIDVGDRPLSALGPDAGSITESAVQDAARLTGVQ